MSDPQLNALLAAAFSFSVLGVVTKIALTLINRRRPTELPRERAAVEERLARIESIVEATALEVERIGEGQRFTTRLLQERGAQPVAPQRLPGQPGQSITPH